MSLHKTSRYQLRCDECSREGASGGTEEAAEKAAAKSGWKLGRDFYGNRFHLCFECLAEKGLPDWWTEEAE